MKKHLYSLFSVLTVALLMVACGPDNAFIKPIKAGINAEDYQTALIAADTAIFHEPENGQPYYYKGIIYSKMAKAEPVPGNRLPYYEKMHSNLVIAQEKFDAMEESPDEAKLIPSLVIENWGKEHNAAIGYATVDSIKATVDEPLEISIAHLVNATTINPDSSLSYDVLAQIYVMNSEYVKAAESLKKALAIRGADGSSDYDRLANYYFQVGDYESALSAIETGLELYPDSISLVQKVADAYFQTGQTEKALDVVNQLIETDPQNPQYRLVVGTQLYQQVQVLTDELKANNDKIFDLKNDDGSETEIAALSARNDEILSISADLTEQAESALIKAAELDPDNFTTFNTLGILYQNKAASFYELRNATSDNDEAARYDDLARAEAEKAIGYYEKAAEIRPDDQGIWQTLFQIYTILDYREKAEAAMEKAGM